MSKDNPCGRSPSQFLYKLLAFLVLLSTTLSADTQDFLKKGLNPYSHTYTQDTLKGVRLARPQIEALAHSKSSLILFTVFPALMRPLTLSSTDNVFFSGGVLFPCLMLNLGLDGSVKYLYEIAKRNDKFEALNAFFEYIQAAGRLNLVLGHLYQYPFYIRGAYDYISFGDHHSEVVQARDMITRTRLQRRCLIGEIGGAWTSVHSEWQGSTTLFLGPVFGENTIKEDAIVAIVCKGQYTKDRPMFSTALNIIQSYQIGAGIGFGNNEVQGEEGVLLNGYSHVFFCHAFDVYMEYLYDSLIEKHVKNQSGRREKRHNRSSHAFHIEGAKHFKSIFRWNIPSAITIGYMQGDRTMESAVQGVFSACKLKLLKEHIHVLFGGRWDVLGSEGIKPLIRIDVSF